MGTKARIAALSAGIVVSAVASLASAETMDPAIERLVIDESCRTPEGAWTEGDDPTTTVTEGTCEPDHVAFKKLINQFGFAFAPTAMHSARTTGFGGFHLSLEADYTKIDSGASYWKKGTRGKIDPSSKKASIRNTAPADMLQLYSVKLRKSFGFGLELMGQVGFMPKTSIVSGGADVRLSLLEGFRSGLPGVLPDLAVGGGVRTITGTPQFQLSVAGLDVQISKPLPVADSSIVTPYVGYQYVWIWGDSGLVDLTPATDPVGYCNYAGANLPGNHDPTKTANGERIYDGQPRCPGGSPADFNNNTVFKKVRLERQRLIFGLSYRYEMVMIGGQFITDIVDPADAQNSDTDKKDLKGVPRQWTLAFEVGAMF